MQEHIDEKSANGTISYADHEHINNTIVRSSDSKGWSGLVCSRRGDSHEVVVKSLFSLMAAYTVK